MKVYKIESDNQVLSQWVVDNKVYDYIVITLSKLEVCTGRKVTPSEAIMFWIAWK